MRDPIAGVLREFFFNTPNSHAKDSCRSLFTEHVSGYKQSNQIRRRIVRCDTRRLVAQQILSILEADSGVTEAMTESVSQIMHPYLRQTGEGRKNSIRTVVMAVMRCFTPY